ncbi:MAG TPA: hypothetical protein VIS73_06645 [Rhodocyclaceae bacterium]
MRVLTVFALATALLSACASAPPQPAAIAQYERDMNRAQDRFHEGRLLAAAAAYRQAVAAGERYDDAARLAPALLGLAAVALELEEFAEAGSHYREAVREADRAGLPGLRLNAEVGAAETVRRSGDCRAASVAGQALLARGPEPGVAARIQLLLANCLTAGGDPRAALATLYAPADTQSPGLQAARLASEAAAHLALGDALAARQAAEAALAIDKHDRHPPAIAADHRLLAEIAAGAGDPDSALAHALRAWRIFRHTGQSRAASRLLAAFPAITK